MFGNHGSRDVNLCQKGNSLIWQANHQAYLGDSLLFYIHNLPKAVIFQIKIGRLRFDLNLQHSHSRWHSYQLSYQGQLSWLDWITHTTPYMAVHVSCSQSPLVPYMYVIIKLQLSDCVFQDFPPTHEEEHYTLWQPLTIVSICFLSPSDSTSSSRVPWSSWRSTWR